MFWFRFSPQIIALDWQFGILWQVNFCPLVLHHFSLMYTFFHLGVDCTGIFWLMIGLLVFICFLLMFMSLLTLVEFHLLDIWAVAFDFPSGTILHFSLLFYQGLLRLLDMVVIFWVFCLWELFEDINPIKKEVGYFFLLFCIVSVIRMFV